jgi:ferredoxin
MSRYEELRKIFKDRRFFKTVCAAGNEDPDSVRKIVTVYAIAGSTMFDLSANLEVVAAAQHGLAAAFELAPRLGRTISSFPYLNVSIGIKGDPHVRKAQIDGALCVQCGECLPVCREEAITPDFVVEVHKCIGCGDCREVCAFQAVSFLHRETILPQLAACTRKGVETMELHAASTDDEEFLNDWRLLNRLIPEHYVSLCLDRSCLSNEHLVRRVREAFEISGARTIIQADGIPMGGEADNYNTTLQAVACADIVVKSGVPVIVLLSGGTNSKTGHLARLCEVRAHGVSIGSWGRKLIRELIKRKDFDDNLDCLHEAVTRAESLIRENLEALSG